MEKIKKFFENLLNSIFIIIIEKSASLANFTQMSFINSTERIS